MICSKCNSNEVVNKKPYEKRFVWSQVLCRECNNKRLREKARTDGYVRAVPGYVYIVINDAWAEWCKFGVTKRDPEERLNDYQIGSPFRDYRIYEAISVDDSYDIEYKVLKKCEELGYEKQSEWVKISAHTLKEIALDIINMEMQNVNK